MSLSKSKKAFWVFSFKMTSLLILLVFMEGISQGAPSSKDKKETVSTLRDPFWPVGYKAKEIETPENQKEKTLLRKDWDEAQKLVIINGVSKLSGEYLAIINTETKAVGEVVIVEYGGREYHWKVESVSSDGNVKLKRVSVE